VWLESLQVPLDGHPPAYRHVGRPRTVPEKTEAEAGMPSASYEQPLRSRVFDYSVVAFGVALALVATGFALSAPEAPAWGYWLAVPVIALIERYPMTLFARTASVQVSFSSCLVAFLSILVPVSAGIMIWSAGVLLAQAVSRVRWSARVFNLGVGLIAGSIGFLVIHAVRGSTREISPRVLAAVAVGCAVMFLIDYLLSEVSVAFEEGSSVTTELITRDMAVALGGVVTVDSVGYLGAIVQRELPQWCPGSPGCTDRGAAHRIQLPRCRDRVQSSAACHVRLGCSHAACRDARRRAAARPQGPAGAGQRHPGRPAGRAAANR
jgi:hypothetical protein